MTWSFKVVFDNKLFSFLLQWRALLPEKRRDEVLGMQAKLQDIIADMHAESQIGAKFFCFA